MNKHPFEYQAPTPEHVAKINRLREAMSEVYEHMLAQVPACAERTLAIRHLEESNMWANKAIVFDGEGYPR